MGGKTSYDDNSRRNVRMKSVHFFVSSYQITSILMLSSRVTYKKNIDAKFMKNYDLILKSIYLYHIV